MKPERYIVLRMAKHSPRSTELVRTALVTDRKGSCGHNTSWRFLRFTVFPSYRMFALRRCERLGTGAGGVLRVAPESEAP